MAVGARIVDEEAFVAWLRVAMRQRGVSVSELARRVGSTRPNISRIVNGHQNPHLDMLVAILDVLDFELQVVKKQ